jgi:CheY-like chemotaxis protein
LPKRILAIDDERRVRDIIGEMLEMNGYAVVKAGSGAEGLEKLAEGGFDLVILDVKMPGMDGYETYEQIRHNTRTEKTPILFLTAFTDSFSMDKGDAMKAWREHFGEGTTDIVYKPVSVEDLATKVQGLIGPAGE